MAEHRIEEENRLLRAALQETQAELAHQRRLNLDLQARTEKAEEVARSTFGQLEIVRSSAIWKMCAPLRVLEEKLRT